jgi:hypothetical protein
VEVLSTITTLWEMWRRAFELRRGLPAQVKRSVRLQFPDLEFERPSTYPDRGWRAQGSRQLVVWSCHPAQLLVVYRVWFWHGMDMDDFEDSIWDGQLETVLEHNLRLCERWFFKNVPPVMGIETVANADFPAKYEVARNVIQLDAGLARFPKLARLLIVHELVHHKLWVEDPTYANSPYGPKYRAAIKALSEKDAYLDLL